MGTLCELIKMHFRKSGLSQSSLSQRSGVSAPYLNRVLACKQIPGQAAIDKIAAALDLSDVERKELTPARMTAKATGTARATIEDLGSTLTPIADGAEIPVLIMAKSRGLSPEGQRLALAYVEALFAAYPRK
jgi:transcriptional regulator with XRE-family HTH domain